MSDCFEIINAIFNIKLYKTILEKLEEKEK